MMPVTFCTDVVHNIIRTVKHPAGFAPVNLETPEKNEGTSSSKSLAIVVRISPKYEWATKCNLNHPQLYIY
jgi:hypothetical protein